MTLVAIGLVVLPWACSPSSGGINPSGVDDPTSTAAISTTSSSTPVAVPSTTAVDATKAAILAAYRGMLADSDSVTYHYPVDERNPVLLNHMAGDELARVRNFATTLNHLGQYLAGPPPDTGGAIVKQLKGSAAVVSDCHLDHSVLMDGSTNRVVKAATTQRTLINVKVELIAGTWKVTEFSNVGVECTVAS